MPESSKNARGAKYEPEFNSGVVIEAVPGRHQKPETLQEMLARFVRNELSRTAEKQGLDSFEDADDFEEEDPEVLSLTHHEVIAMSREELQDYAPNGVQLVEAPQESPEEKVLPAGRQESAEIPPATAQSKGSPGDDDPA